MFSQQLAEVTELISSLEGQVKEIDLLAFSQKVESFKSKLVGIQKKSVDSVYASQWLQTHRDSLIQYACEVVFEVSQDGRRIAVRGGKYLQISSDGYRLFQRDIYVYIKWISHYLGMEGMTPRVLKKDLLSLPIDYSLYIKAFEAIKSNKIALANRTEISAEALQILVRYFNRFLINREYQEL